LILNQKAEMYPHIEPYDAGLLGVRDGHHVYWEICGNPSGKPALVLHGGPGFGCSTGMRRYFNPEVYRIVLLDQRGSGRSKPHASEPVIDLSANTTAHLISSRVRINRAKVSASKSRLTSMRRPSVNTTFQRAGFRSTTVTLDRSHLHLNQPLSFTLSVDFHPAPI
jgi:hypothetical protein